jgi:hypothetical protein
MVYEDWRLERCSGDDLCLAISTGTVHSYPCLSFDSLCSDEITILESCRRPCSLNRRVPTLDGQRYVLFEYEHLGLNNIDDL